MSDEQIASKLSQALSEIFDSLDLEACPVDPCLAFNRELRNCLIKESWIKAVDWDELLNLCGLVDSPIDDRIVMNS